LLNGNRPPREGHADHIAQSGIDRWIGGVQLNGGAARWRRDEGTESIV